MKSVFRACPSSRPVRRLAFALLVCAFAAAPAFTADSKKGDKKDDEDEKTRPEPVTMAEALKDTTPFEGLFTIHRDDSTGELLMLVRKEQFDKDYIHCTFVADAVVDAGHFRGEFRDNRIVVFRRHFDRVEVIAPNLAFYFEPGHPLSRAAEANRPPAILAVAPIVGEDKQTGDVVIEAGGLFLEETLTQVSLVYGPEVDDSDPALFKPGELDEDRTRVVSVRGYPRNTDVVVDYVFHNPAPRVTGGPDVTDARFITTRVQHSFLATPESGYTPRFADPRVGYFASEQTDLTSTSAAPYRDLVQRWKLVKKQPGAALSEPLEPITFWIENTTPRELRPLVREGVLAWNTAFEAAGFKNALVVHEQPDDSAWDAGDVRYNVLRWASSPRPQFGGYGPSFVDPRTGQILGADIMLEFVYATNRLIEENTFTKNPAPARSRDRLCSLGLHRHADILAGRAVARAMGLGEAAQARLFREAIIELIMHEVGHTLGLQHNMRASQFHAPDEIHDSALTGRVGVSASVMDYNAINLAPAGSKQGQFFNDRPGVYDIWAIQFGYAESLLDAAAETARLEKLLARSTEPGLAFGNDADDMRAPGYGVDPRVMIEDMSADPLGYGERRFVLLESTLDRLPARTGTAGGLSYDDLIASTGSVLRKYSEAAEAVSRFIGGVYIENTPARLRAPDTQPFTPVPMDEQKRALAILREHVFAPAAFALSPELIAQLKKSRRGFHAFEQPDEPRLHETIAGLHGGLLNHLLHPRVLARMTDARLYGGAYPVAEYGADLTGALFADDTPGDVNTIRQNLQADYVRRLAEMLDPETTPDHRATARAMALQQLEEIRSLIAAAPIANRETQAHRSLLRHRIDAALLFFPRAFRATQENGGNASAR